MGCEHSIPAKPNIDNTRDGYDLSNAVNTLYEQKVELEKIRHKNAKQQETINHQRYTINSNASQISQITNSNKAKEAEIIQLKRNVAALRINVETSAMNIQQLTAQKDEYETLWLNILKSTLENDKAELQTNNDRLIREKNNLQQNLNDSLKANQQQKENHEVNINKMKKNTEKEIAEMKKRLETVTYKCDEQLSQMKAKCEKEIVENVEAANRETQARIKKVEKENAKLSDPNRICSIKDVVAYGKVDYIHLNGKILMVQKLENDNGKWYTDDGTEITFEHSDFQICVHNELIVKHIELSTLGDRVFYSNIKKLCLADLTISFDEYKNIVANIKVLSLRRITVKGKHGIIIDLADLLKEVPDIEQFEYIFKDDEKIPTQKLVQPPSFSKLKQFNLCEVQEDFDFMAFTEFYNNNPSILCEISLRCSTKFYEKVKNTQKDTVTSKNIKIIKLK